MERVRRFVPPRGQVNHAKRFLTDVVLVDGPINGCLYGSGVVGDTIADGAESRIFRRYDFASGKISAKLRLVDVLALNENVRDGRHRPTPSCLLAPSAVLPSATAHGQSRLGWVAAGRG